MVINFVVFFWGIGEVREVDSFRVGSLGAYLLIFGLILILISFGFEGRIL